jgi:transposase
VLTPEERRAIYEQRMEGMKIEYLATVFGVATSTIINVIKRTKDGE